jgi:tetratricopeptide (TPR) repeat protein
VTRRLRYTFILAIAALGTALAAAGGWRYARASAPVPGPVILISVDTLRADHLPAYGYHGVRTPAIDALARDGVIFERAYAHSTQTLPSHAAMLTGRMPFENGVRDDEGPGLAASERPLAQMLRDRGYATGGIVSSAILGRASGLSRGFDFFDDPLTTSELPRDLPAAFHRRSGAQSEEIAERWLTGLGTTRLFLFLHLDELRAPRASTYDEAIAATDATIGKFVKYLKAHQLYDQSTILLVSDHGEGLGEHGEQEHGLFVYDNTIHVPMIVKPAAGLGAGRRIADVVQLADVVPTVLDLVKAPGPGNLRGRSLKPLTEGPATLTPATVYSESVWGHNRFGWSILVAETGGKGQQVRATSETEADPAGKAAVAQEYRAAMRLVSDRKWPEAIDALQKIASAEPGAIAAWTTLVDVAALSERYDIALAAAQHIVDFMPDDPAALVRTARVAFAARKLDEAASSAQQAVDLGSKKPRVMADAHTVLALVALARYDADTARSEAMEVQAAEPASLLPVFVEARLLVDEGNDAGALAVLEKAAADVEKAQARPLRDLQLLTGEILVRSDRAAEAEVFFLQELRDFPHNINASTALATLYQSMGQTDEAARVAADLVRITPSPEAYTAAAKLWTSFGDRTQAAAVRADARKLFTHRNAH